MLKKIKNISLPQYIEYLFYFFVFMLPWQMRYIWKQGFIADGVWEYGTFSLYGTEIIFYLILGLFLYGVVRKKGITFFSLSNDKKWKIPAVFWSMAVLELTAFISVFYAPETGVAIYGWLKLLQGMILFFVILSIKFSYQKVFTVMIASGLIQSIMGLIQFWYKKFPACKWLGLSELDASYLGTSVIEYIVYVEKLGKPFGHRWLRVHGSLPHPNIIALFLLAVIICSLAVYLSKTYSLKKLLPMIGMLLIFPAFLLTFSRSAWIGLAVVFCLFWLAVLLKPKYTKELKELKSDTIFNLSKFTLFCLMITVVTVLIYPNLFSVRFSNDTRLEKRSTIERLSGLLYSVEVIKENWYKGVGIRNYTTTLPKMLDEKIVNEFGELEETRKHFDYQPVHNIYLLVMAELGIVGFFAFIALLLITIINIMKQARRLVTDYYFLGVTALFCAMLLVGLFDHYLWTLNFGIMFFWLIMGLLYKKLINSELD